MAKYQIIRNFTARSFQFELPNPNAPTKAFNKGDIVDAQEQSDFGKNKHLVTSDGFDITNKALPYSGKHHAHPIGMNNPKTFFTPKVKLGLGIAATIAVIFLAVKYLK